MGVFRELFGEGGHDTSGAQCIMNQCQCCWCAHSFYLKAISNYAMGCTKWGCSCHLWNWISTNCFSAEGWHRFKYTMTAISKAHRLGNCFANRSSTDLANRSALLISERLFTLKLDSMDRLQKNAFHPYRIVPTITDDLAQPAAVLGNCVTN